MMLSYTATMLLAPSGMAGGCQVRLGLGVTATLLCMEYRSEANIQTQGLEFH